MYHLINWLGNRVMTSPVPGVASCHSLDRKPRSFCGTISGYCFFGILRAGRMKSTGWGQHRAYQQFVAPQQVKQKSLHCCDKTVLRACLSNVFASEKSTLSMFPRKRTTISSSTPLLSNVRNVSLTIRLILFRCTALGTDRFPTFTPRRENPELLAKA